MKPKQIADFHNETKDPLPEAELLLALSQAEGLQPLQLGPIDQGREDPGSEAYKRKALSAIAEVKEPRSAHLQQPAGPWVPTGPGGRRDQGAPDAGVLRHEEDAARCAADRYLDQVQGEVLTG